MRALVVEGDENHAKRLLLVADELILSSAVYARVNAPLTLVPTEDDWRFVDWEDAHSLERFVTASGPVRIARAKDVITEKGLDHEELCVVGAPDEWHLSEFEGGAKGIVTFGSPRIALLEAALTGSAPAEGRGDAARSLAQAAVNLAPPADVVTRQTKALLLRYKIAGVALTEDEIDRLSVEQILEFRILAKDAYLGWQHEVGRLLKELHELPPEERKDAAYKAIFDNTEKRLREYDRGMLAARRKLGAGLAKEVGNANRLLIGAAVAASGIVDLAAVATAILGSTAFATLPHLVQYQTDSERARSDNPFAYLIGVRALGDRSSS